MMTEENFKGVFVADASIIKQKLQRIKAFVFDWDGVFNNGRKDIEGNSSFSEVDSMGVNMMRFSYYLLHNKLPVCIIITGENNKLAISFAQREGFHSVFYKMINKKLALEYLCEQHDISAEEVLFVFDDVLDFPVAQRAGVRCMIGRSATTLLQEFAINNLLVDYITQNDGSKYAVREVAELIMMLQGNFETAIENRMHFTDKYKEYLSLRNSTATEFYFTKEHQIIQDISI